VLAKAAELPFRQEDNAMELLFREEGNAEELSFREEVTLELSLESIIYTRLYQWHNKEAGSRD
jgi:hypothetical protein